jgi:putative tryptophan/tyrosine transport system substrate-binding protein
MLSKSTFTFLALIAILGGIVCFKLGVQETVDPFPTIGIIQTATHPALDQTRESFSIELSRLLNGKVRFLIQNAEGSLAQAQSIAESFHTHSKISAIFAIGTPAVQAAARVEKRKPIFIAAVSDPDSLGVIFPGTNVCGTTDRIDTDAQANLIQSILPATKTVAILYNPGESNSQAMVEKMKHSLECLGLIHASYGVISENQIAQTIATASRKAQVILIPPDNLVAGAITLVSKEALLKKCPVFASDILLVAQGAFIAQGANYSDLGKQTAIMAHKVLTFENTPQEAGIVHPSDSKILVNKRISEELHICIPQNLVPFIDLIDE